MIKKEHQRTGESTPGVVGRSLGSSPYHPRGIKGMLEDGVVGRVCHIHEEADTQRLDSDQNKQPQSTSQRDQGKRQFSSSAAESGESPGFNTLEIPPEVLERLQKQFDDPES